MGARGPKPHPQRDEILEQWVEMGSTWPAAVELSNRYDDVAANTIMTWARRTGLEVNRQPQVRPSEVRAENVELKDEIIELMRENRRLRRVGKTMRKTLRKTTAAVSDAIRMGYLRPNGGGDHACRECHPDGEIVKDGFRCSYHTLLGLVNDG